MNAVDKSLFLEDEGFDDLELYSFDNLELYKFDNLELFPIFLFISSIGSTLITLVVGGFA